MTTPLDYEKFMPRGYTLVRTEDWVLTDPAVGTNIPINFSGPVDIYVTWEGETSIALVLIAADGSRRTLETGAHAIRYTLGAKDGDMVTVTGTSGPFPVSEAGLRGTLKILPTVSFYL